MSSQVIVGVGLLPSASESHARQIALGRIANAHPRVGRQVRVEESEGEKDH